MTEDFVSFAINIFQLKLQTIKYFITFAPVKLY